MRSRKKYYFVLCVVLFLLLLLSALNHVFQSSYVAKKDAIKTTDFADISKRGTMNVVLENNSMNYFVYKGTPMGYQYEIVSLLAKDFGLIPKITISNDMEEAFRRVAFGDCDLVAMDVSVVENRYPQIAFTDNIYYLRAMLVQRKDETLIKDLKSLDGKTVCVPNSSHFVKQLKDIEDSLKINIKIVEINGVESEELIRLLISEDIDYTVCDENLAKINSTYYANLDCSLEISEPFPMAWVVSANATYWLDTLNSWLHDFTHSYQFKFLQAKYFDNPLLGRRVDADYHSLSGNKLSPYDKIIQKYSKEIDWDWRLVASLIYQESRFEDNYSSYSGAFGVMQLMPVTAAKFGVFPESNIETQVRGGCRLLHHLDTTFAAYVSDDFERQKLVVGAYNLGEAHFFDAFALGEKYDFKTETWDEIYECLSLKSKSKYYNDRVVKYGYCNPWYVKVFVKEVFERFEHYKNIFPDSKK